MGTMAASDAAPLPRLGEVFFDVRGSSRSMRLSWYADTGVAVFSIWQGGTCTGTFRLPIGDLPRMIDALQRGPRGASSSSGGYQGVPDRANGMPETGALAAPGRGGSGGYPARTALPQGEDRGWESAGAVPQGHGPPGAPGPYGSREGALPPYADNDGGFRAPPRQADPMPAPAGFAAPPPAGFPGTGEFYGQAPAGFPGQEPAGFPGNRTGEFQARPPAGFADPGQADRRGYAQAGGPGGGVPPGQRRESRFDPGPPTAAMPLPLPAERPQSPRRDYRDDGLSPEYRDNRPPAAEYAEYGDDPRRPEYRDAPPGWDYPDEPRGQDYRTGMQEPAYREEPRPESFPYGAPPREREPREHREPRRRS